MQFRGNLCVISWPLLKTVIGFEILYVTLLQLISRNGTHLINLFNDAINFHIESKL